MYIQFPTAKHKQYASAQKHPFLSPLPAQKPFIPSSKIFLKDWGYSSVVECICKALSSKVPQPNQTKA